MTGSKLSAMLLPGIRLVVLAALVALFGSMMSAQDKTVLVTLTPPTYLLIAREAHITGDMELTVKVNKDGTVASASVDSGPALILLREATLASVKQSRFDCRSCRDEPETVRVEYSYNLDDPEPCAGNRSNALDTETASPYPRISHSGNHVTVIERAISACDPAVLKFRSIKCLYLWACSSK
jgi:hypothetical protein